MFRPKLTRLITSLSSLAILWPLNIHAANISMTSSDLLTGNESSFDSSLANGNHWSNGAVPNAGNDYFTGNFVLRTPANSASLTFAGDSLTINNTNGFNSGGLFYKGTGTTGVVTINNLILAGGTVTHQQGTGDLFRLAGNVNVTVNSQLYARQGAINVSAVIGGTASITNPGSDCTGCILTFSSPTNTFTGNLINNGRFTLADDAKLNFAIGAAGVNNSISGSGAATVLNGDFAFNLSGASTTLNDSWTVVSAANRTFGSTFSVAGFSEVSAGQWQNGIYQFSESTGVLSVTTPPAQLTLRVNNATGVISIVNNSSSNFDMNYYEIHSPAGALDVNGWASIDGDIPPSTTSWEKTGGSTSELLSETTLLGVELFSPTESASLGHAYAGTLPAHQNLQFYYGTTTSGDTLLPGIVEFVGGPPGDFNGDTDVDGADYVVWRNTDGTVAGYHRWRANFGATGSGGGESVNVGAVPEPSAAMLICIGFMIFHLQRQRSFGQQGPNR